jgi:hypothetical protein
MEADRYTTSYAGLAGEVFMDFDPTAHAYGIGPTPESLDAVPAAGDLCNYIPKYLTSWGQRIGVEMGIEIRRLAQASGLPTNDWLHKMAAEHGITEVPANPYADPKFLQQIGRKLGLDHDSVRQKAADRGSMIHSAYRGFVLNGVLPNPGDYSTAEAKGYINSLRMFCQAIEGNFETILCEEPICSPSLGFAGTPDHYCHLKRTRVQVGGNATKRPKFEDAFGRVLIDLKTSAQVYDSHKWQLSCYEQALVECGFEPPEKRVIVLIKADSEGFNWKPQESRVGGVKHLVGVWEADNRPEGWKWPQVPTEAVAA